MKIVFRVVFLGCGIDSNSTTESCALILFYFDFVTMNRYFERQSWEELKLRSKQPGTAGINLCRLENPARYITETQKLITMCGFVLKLSKENPNIHETHENDKQKTTTKPESRL